MRKIRIPTYHIPTIFDLKAESIKSKGYKVILTDLDNTLDCYQTAAPSARVIDKIKEFKDAGLEMIIISNNWKGRVSIYAEQAGLEARYLMLKPFAFKLKKLLKEKNLRPEQVLMVGDQIFTDIGAGNRAKVHTVFVDPLTPLDQPFTRIKRHFEKPILKKLKKKNLLKEWED